MSTTPADDPQESPTPVSGWARPVSYLNVTSAPEGAINLNVGGRQVLSPLQGFGQLWQKTYRVRLPGVKLSAAEVMKIWKAEFPTFQPKETRFHPPAEGIQPGSIIFIDLVLPVAPGLPNAIPVASGVMVLYADEVSFAVTTPQGFPLSGWNNFSILEEDDCLVAQVQSIERATDPIYEFGNLVMRGAHRQEQNWMHTLTALARRFGVESEPVELDRKLLDPKWQWKEARNIWYNAGVRTVLYKLATPVRFVRDRRAEAASRGDRSTEGWLLVAAALLAAFALVLLGRLVAALRRR